MEQADVNSVMRKRKQKRSVGIGSILVEAEAEAEALRNMPLRLPLCFKVAVQILVDFC
jgi:hypothetical protein